MVIVTLPASVEKVAEIAGAEAAARVEAYNKEVSGEAERERMAAKEQAKAEQTAKERQNRSVSLQSRQPERKPRRNGWSVNAWQRNKSKKSVWKRRNKPACKLKKRQ